MNYNNKRVFLQKVAAEELKKNKETIALLEKLSKGAPDGRVIRRNNKDGRPRYYLLRDDSTQEKPKLEKLDAHRDAELIRSYRAKQLLKKKAEKLRRNVSVLQSLLDDYTPIDVELGPVLPERFRAESPYQSSLPAQKLTWDMVCESDGNFKTEGRTIESDGSYYRSKSEAMIASRLVLAGVEFVYEPAIRCGLITIHPDFALRNRRTGKVYLWEHFGMLDKAEYQDYFKDKIASLLSLGIVPGSNLLMTAEFKDTAVLGISDIDALIKAYLL